MTIEEAIEKYNRVQRETEIYNKIYGSVIKQFEGGKQIACFTREEWSWIKYLIEKEKERLRDTLREEFKVTAEEDVDEQQTSSESSSGED